MDEVLTTKEAAELLKMPKRTISYLIQTNQIPFCRVGKRTVKFSKDRLWEWFKEREGIELRYNKG